MKKLIQFTCNKIGIYQAKNSHIHLGNETVKQMISTEKLAGIHTFDSSQKAGSENQVSSTITSGVRVFPLNIVATMEDVTTTLLMEGTFVHDLRTLSVPFTAGSINST